MASLVGGRPRSIVETPILETRYTKPESREKTVVICGGSSSKPGTVGYEPFAAKLAAAVVRAGGNVVTGAGTHGPMGAAFHAGAAAAVGTGAGENLTVMHVPAYGDEDFVHGRAVGKATTDEIRFDEFQRLGATVVICPGGTGALLEGAKAIYGVAYPHPTIPAFDTILIVGDFYKPLQAQVDVLVKAGTLKPEQAARIRFAPADDAVIDEIVSKVAKAVRAA